ncbi:MAG: SoxY-related AACIE arm protein [Pseudomonadota bacterium]
MTADTTRRRLLTGAGSMLAITLVPRHGLATPDKMQAEIAALYGERAITEGRVTLKMPALAENGNSVPMRVSVPDSPMTAEDHVRSITVFSPENPLPVIARFHLSPRSGKADVALRIRLADSQVMVAIAEMSDGTLWRGTAETIVTLAACIDLT